MSHPSRRDRRVDSVEFGLSRRACRDDPCYVAPVLMRLLYLARHEARVPPRQSLCARDVAPLFLPHYAKDAEAVRLLSALLADPTSLCSQLHGGLMFGGSRGAQTSGVVMNNPALL